MNQLELLQEFQRGELERARIVATALNAYAAASTGDAETQAAEAQQAAQWAEYVETLETEPG